MKKKINENDIKEIIYEIKNEKLMELMLPFHLKNQSYLFLIN